MSTNREMRVIIPSEEKKDLINSIFCHFFPEGFNREIEISMYFFQGDTTNSFFSLLSTDKIKIFFNDSIPLNILIRVGCHQMQHIRQYNQGRLRFINSGFLEFDGKEYDITNSRYVEMPWEIEARAMEDELVDNYLKEINILIWPKRIA